MKKLVLIAAWFFAAGAALAQPQNAQERARQQLEHESVTLADATTMIADAIDANHDHRISRAEWLAYWPAPSGISTSYNPTRDFDGYDHNHDGYLDGRQEALPAVQQAVRTAQTDCDANVDNVFSGADELSCLYDYATPHPQASAGAPAQSAARPNQTSAPHASGAQGPVDGAQIYQLAAARLDADHDNRISPTEWRNLTHGTDFDTYDANRNGFIEGAETARAVGHVVDIIISECDSDFDQVLSDPQELACLARYIPPEQNAPNAATQGQSSAPRASGSGATLRIEASLRAPGPGRVFAPVANVPVYLSSRDLEQTLAAAGLTRPSPVGAWLIACQAQASSAACQQGVTAVRGNDPAARGVTDAQGHFTFSSAPVGHYFVVAIGSLTPGHTFIWCVPIDIHAGDNELTLGGHNLYVDPSAPPG